MLDYQCVTEVAVASSRRRNSSSKADTRNFVCGRGSSHLRQSLVEPNDLSRHLSCQLSRQLSCQLSRQLCQYATYLSWQAIKSPDSLQLSIIMTCTSLNINNFSGKHGNFPEKSGNSRHCQCSDNGLIPICRKCT